jgi:hypothetical protein
MTQTLLGDQGTIEHNHRKSWTYNDGERESWEVRGTQELLDGVYALYKLAAGGNPAYESLDYDPGYGYGRVLISRTEDGAAVYELLANEFGKRPEHHSYFQSLGADTISATLKAFNDGVDETKSGYTSKQLELLRHLYGGVDAIPDSGYVLRVSQTCSKRSILRPSYSGVNTVQTPPDVAAANALIGNLPDGEWLKKAPQVITVGPRKWRIVQEWWWAEKWSCAVGGTLYQA